MRHERIKNHNHTEDGTPENEITRLKRQIIHLVAERDLWKQRVLRDDSQQRYRTIFENTGAATILIDADFTISACNHRFAQLVGLCSKDIEGKIKWPQFIHPQDLVPMKAYHQTRRISSENAPKNYEFRLITEKGEIRFIIITIDMIPGSLQSVASLVDISDRIKAEKALKASEEKYRLLVETMNDGLVIQDQNSILTYANPRASAMLGFSVGELLGKATIRFLAEDSVVIWKKQIALRKKGNHQPYEIVWLHKHGQRIHTIVSPRPLFDEHKRFQGSFAILTDISDYKRTLESLRLSEEMFSKAFRSSPISIFIATLTERRIINVNDSFIKNTGHGMFEVIGKTFSQIKLFVDPAYAEQAFVELSQKGCLHQLEIQFYTKNGEIRKGVMSAERIQLWKKPYILVSIEDVTTTFQLQRQIMQVSERERHRIGRDLHDDLCPHLIGIEALSNVLLRQLENEKSQKNALLKKIRRLIQGAIDKTRCLSHGLCSTNLVDQGLIASLNSLADQIQTVYGIICDFICLTKFDITAQDIANHIYLIAQEAAINAVKHSHCKRIDIILEETDKRPLLMIRDDGCGLPQNMRTNGMGLSLIRFRAKVIGAQLKINSQVNQGTEVSLLLATKTAL
ncbi:MAG: PAS domain S-box protein [Desulfobacteraceae bacterium]